jgi:DNA-binding MarR family transcriptional regulator
MPKDLCRSKLLPSHKLVLMYVYNVENCNIQQIAADLDLSVANVRKILKNLRAGNLLEVKETRYIKFFCPKLPTLTNNYL